MASLFGVAVATAARYVLPARSAGPDTQAPQVKTEVAAVVAQSEETVEAVSAHVFPSGYVADGTVANPLYLRGYVVRGRHFNAVLSDGRTITERDGLVREIRRNGIEMKDGTWVQFRPVQLSPGSKIEAPAKAEPVTKTGKRAEAESPLSALLPF